MIFFPSRMTFTIIVDTSIQVDIRILVHPILIDAKMRFFVSQEAKYREVALAR